MDSVLNDPGKKSLILEALTFYRNHCESSAKRKRTYGDRVATLRERIDGENRTAAYSSKAAELTGMLAILEDPIQEEVNEAPAAVVTWNDYIRLTLSKQPGDAFLKKILSSTALSLKNKAYPPRFNGKTPLRVRMLETVEKDTGISGPEVICFSGEEYFVFVNSFGNVTALITATMTIQLKMSQYEVTVFHEDPAGN